MNEELLPKVALVSPELPQTIADGLMKSEMTEIKSDMVRTKLDKDNMAEIKFNRTEASSEVPEPLLDITKFKSELTETKSDMAQVKED
jgi:hypothetical protein